MLKAEMALERIFGTFIPGGFLLIVSWYLHRPFLFKYFPNIAGDPSQSVGLSTEFKVVILLVASFCTGLLLNQLADVGIALMFKDDASTEKSMQRTRRVVRAIWRRVAFSLKVDPRTRAVLRYINSPRKDRFLRMMEDWAATTDERLKNNDEMIVAHQHVVVHLKTLSDKSRKLLNEAELPVVFSSSVLMAFVLLIPIAALSFWTSEIVDEKITVHFVRTLGATLVLLYAGLILSSYSLKRQFKQFCNYVLTLALHFHGLPNQAHMNAGVPLRDGSEEP